MNGIEVKRAVYYGLLIICLAAALLTVFLPFAYEPICFLGDISLAPMSILAALMPGTLTRIFQEYYYNWVQLAYAVLLFSAGVTTTLLIRALLRVLRSLNCKLPFSAPVHLGATPTVGICFFALLMILGILNQSYLNESTETAFYFPPIWPLVGLLLNLSAKGLARGLRETDKDPSDQSEINIERGK